MKEREEVRGGKKVTVVEKEQNELTAYEQLLGKLASLETRVTMLEQQLAKPPK